MLRFFFSLVLFNGIWIFSFDTHAYRQKPMCNININLPSGLQSKVEEALEFIASIQSSDPHGKGSVLHEQVFKGAVSGITYCRYLEEAIGEIRRETDRDPPASRVARYEDDRKVLITKTFKEESVLKRALTLLHEARHGAGEAMDHVRCPDPFVDEKGRTVLGPISQSYLGGKKSCDATAVGGYGVSYIFLRNIQKYCTNCSDKILDEAQALEHETLVRVIDSSSKALLKNDVQF